MDNNNYFNNLQNMANNAHQNSINYQSEMQRLQQEINALRYGNMQQPQQFQQQQPLQQNQISNAQQQAQYQQNPYNYGNQMPQIKSPLMQEYEKTSRYQQKYQESIMNCLNELIMPIYLNSKYCIDFCDWANKDIVEFEKEKNQVNQTQQQAMPNLQPLNFPNNLQNNGSV